MYCAVFSAALSCRGTAQQPARASEGAPACPASVSAVLPQQPRDLLVLQPRRVFEHPRMSRLVSAFVDDASERAVLLRAQRYGYDARLLDHAAIAWTVRGSTLYVGEGSFDGAVIAGRLHDRLVGPRQQTEDRAHNRRVTGELGSGPVALTVRPACRMAAYVEGREGALVDRLMQRSPASIADPASAVHYRTTRTIDDGAAIGPNGAELPREGMALLRFVRAITVDADPIERGLEVRVWLEGALPSDAETTLRRVASELSQSPLGELMGAVQWASPSRLRIAREEARGARIEAVIPWGALEALVNSLAGRV